MTTTQGPKVAHRPPVALPPAMAALQKWRNADHEDHIFLTRDDVVTLIEEVCARVAELEGQVGALRELRNFLGGTGPLDGVWFGDEHPTKPGWFWWREELSRIDKLTVGSAALSPAGEAGQ